MIHQIGMLVAKIRQALFRWRMEWEIYNKIAPHIHRKKDYGYPFDSPEGLFKAAIRGKLDLKLHIEIIEQQADHMGKVYGEAFRFAMYRELTEQTLRYVKFAQKRVPHQYRIARFAV